MLSRCLMSLQVDKHREHLINYIIFLRITPFLPNWFINITSPVINVPLGVFFLGTFLGKINLQTRSLLQRTIHSHTSLCGVAACKTHEIVCQMPFSQFKDNFIGHKNCSQHTIKIDPVYFLKSRA